MKRQRESKIVFDEIPGLEERIKKKVKKETEEKLDDLIEKVKIKNSVPLDDSDEEYSPRETIEKIEEPKREKNEFIQDNGLPIPYSDPRYRQKGVYTLDSYLNDVGDNPSVIKSLLNLTVGGIATAGGGVAAYNLFKYAGDYVRNFFNTHPEKFFEPNMDFDKDDKSNKEEIKIVEQKDDVNFKSNNKYTTL